MWMRVPHGPAKCTTKRPVTHPQRRSTPAGRRRGGRGRSEIRGEAGSERNKETIMPSSAYQCATSLGRLPYPAQPISNFMLPLCPCTC